MQKQLILKGVPTPSLEFYKFPQLENKCNQLLKEDEIRFTGVINSMGNLIAGGLTKDIDWLETNEQRRMLYIQMALEISMRKDFDNTLGEINYVTTIRGNVLMITIPMNNHILLISAKPTAIVERIITKVHDLKFFQSED